MKSLYIIFLNMEVKLYRKINTFSYWLMNAIAELKPRYFLSMCALILVAPTGKWADD